MNVPLKILLLTTLGFSFGQLMTRAFGKPWLEIGETITILWAFVAMLTFLSASPD